MDTLFSLKVFREVVRQGSFTRAADKISITSTANTTAFILLSPFLRLIRIRQKQKPKPDFSV